MEFNLCQCCASQQNLNSLTARYAKILESIFSLKISEPFINSYVCNDCISVLIDTSIFQMRIDRTQKAIKAKILVLKVDKQIITQQRKSNQSIRQTIKNVRASKDLTKSNIFSSSTSRTSIKLDGDISDSDHSNDNFEAISIKDEKPTPSAQERITIDKIFDQLDTKTLVCHICQEQQLSFTLLTRHMNLHYPNFVCETCGKGFMTQSRLRSHAKSHNPTPQKCDVCGLTFRNVNTLMSHRQTKHLVQKPHKCHICGERFIYRYRKIKHLADVHGQTEKKYKCHHCPMTFLTASCRSSHFGQTHRREYKHVCEVCGKSFSGNEKLRRHMTSHTTDRPFQCAQCPKAYPRKNTLREHIRIHENDKRFSCEICGRAFTQKCSLKGHMKVHERKDGKFENAVD